MPDALTLIVFVAAGETSTTATQAMLTAARDALGPQSRFVVRELAGARGRPEDTRALDEERTANADGVIELHWADARHRYATLRMHLAKSARWFDRRIAFRSSDADLERGRALGFSIAAVFPIDSNTGASRSGPPPGGALDAEAGSEPQPTAPQATAPPVDSNAPDAGTPGGAPTAAPQSGSDASGSPSGNRDVSAKTASPSSVGARAPAANSSPATPPSAPPATVEPFSHIAGRFGLDLLFAGAADGVEINGGGRAAARFFVLREWSIEAGCSVRAGAISAASAETFVVTPTLGLAFHLAPLQALRPLRFSLRVDLALPYEAVSRFAQTPNRYGPDWVPGVDAVVDVSWPVYGGLDAALGVGAETVFATTDLSVSQAVVATLPWLHAVGEAGARFRF